MKKIIVSLLVIGIVAIICLLIKMLFFNKTIPTGDTNGEFLTNYSSKDMLGNWDINITKQSVDLIAKSIGVMNISSVLGTYFYGTITIEEAIINNKSITGGTLNIEGNVYNDIVTIYFDYNEKFLNIAYDAGFTPKILNNQIILNLNAYVKESNVVNEYIFSLTKMEVYNNEK